MNTEPKDWAHQDTLKRHVDGLMAWLKQNTNPHCSIIIDQDTGRLVSDELAYCPPPEKEDIRQPQVANAVSAPGTKAALSGVAEDALRVLENCAEFLEGMRSGSAAVRAASARDVARRLRRELGVDFITTESDLYDKLPWSREQFSSDGARLIIGILSSHEQGCVISQLKWIADTLKNLGEGQGGFELTGSTLTTSRIQVECKPSAAQACFVTVIDLLEYVEGLVVATSGGRVFVLLESGIA